MKATKAQPIHAGVEILDKAKLVKLADIKPSKDNPRKSIDQEKLKALAESLQIQGLLQPIVIRQVYGTGGFEIIAGERRYRAAKLAGWSEIPACIVKMTDAQAADARLVENDQREDISPLERAAAYQERLNAGQAIEDLANTVGKSVSSVREALLLGRCPQALAEAVTAGRVPGSTAGLVCRVPNQKIRERLTLHVLAGEGWYDDRAAPKLDADNCETLSFRDTKAMIRNKCMIELKGAAFDPLDAALVKAAGTCEQCPKRLGNLQKSDPEGFPAGGRADVCMDPDCYRAKTDAASALKVQEAKGSGRKVLSKTESNRIFQHGGRMAYESAYLDLDHEISYNDQRTYRQILKSELSNGMADKVVIGIDPDGRSHDLIDKKDAKADLKRHGVNVTIHEPQRQMSPAERDADEKKRREKHALQVKIAGEVCLRQFRALAAGAESAWITQQRAFLRFTARALVTSVYGNNFAACCKIAGAECDRDGKRDLKSLFRAIDSMTRLDKLAAVIACGLADALMDIDDSELLKEMESLFTVDLESVEKMIRSELDPPLNLNRDVAAAEAKAIRKAGKKALKAGAV